MDGKRERTKPTPAAPAASAAAVTAVLGNDDLLREILVRLGFPTTLVRAALVCKRWLRHASEPAFLRLFRARHPPALLGFYISRLDLPCPRFVPVSQAPELATVIRRASFPDDLYKIVKDCRNGRGLVLSSVRSRGGVMRTLAVLDLLQPTQGVHHFPTPPPYLAHGNAGMFLPEDGGEGGEGVVALKMVANDTGTVVHAEVYAFQSGAWTFRATPEIQLPGPWSRIVYVLPPANGKIYMATSSILVLDLASTSISAFQLPHSVRTNNFIIHRVEDSGLFLIHAEGFLLSIWHHKADGNGAHNWVLVHDKIIVYEACSRHDDLSVMSVDDNLEYVFLWLEASELLMHMHLRSRTEKVYDEFIMHDKGFLRVTPLMMVWPPVFPALRGENNIEE